MNYDQAITEILKIDGALTAAVVDYDSGMMLSGNGSSDIDLETAAAGTTEVIGAEFHALKMLGSNDQLEDIMVTLGKQYHMMRPIKSAPGLFLYLILDRARANMVVARRTLSEIEGKIA